MVLRGESVGAGRPRVWGPAAPRCCWVRRLGFLELKEEVQKIYGELVVVERQMGKAIGWKGML